MNVTQLIVGLGGVSIATAFGGKIANSLGEYEIAQYIKVAGVGGAGLMSIDIILKLLGKLKGIA